MLSVLLTQKVSLFQLGGFHNGTLGNRSDVGDEDPKSLVGSEMYLRWLQFGALSPMFRTHVSPPAPFRL